jgi:hypothetical protein
MNDQSEQLSESGIKPASPDASKKRHRNLLIVVGSVLLAICICAGVWLGWSVLSMESPLHLLLIEQPAVMAVADQFMTEMENRDAEAAYALFSSHARQYVALSDLEAFFEDDLRALFEGYESLTVTEGGDFEVLLDVVGDEPQMPRGTVANLVAIAKYDGGSEATVTATFEKEDGEWGIYYIDVTGRPTE